MRIQAATSPPLGSSSGDAPCVACGGIAYEVVLDARDFDRGEQPFSLERCRGCGLVRTSPAPSPDELARCYAAEYYGGGETKFVGPAERAVRAFQARRARRMARLARPDGSPGRILDVGCGRGALLHEFARLGWEAHGVERPDFDPAALPRDAVIHTGELAELDLPDASFDLVVFWHVLEHLDDPATSIARAAGLLRPSGVLALSVPNLEAIQARLFGRHWLHLDLPRHLYHFGPATLEAIVRERGLEPIGRHTRAFEQDTFGFVQSLLNAILPGPPNRLYARLKGEDRRLPAAHWILGALAAPLGLLDHVVNGCLGRGATLTLFARRPEVR